MMMDIKVFCNLPTIDSNVNANTLPVVTFNTLNFVFDLIPNQIQTGISDTDPILIFWVDTSEVPDILLSDSM